MIKRRSYGSTFLAIVTSSCKIHISKDMELDSDYINLKTLLTDIWHRVKCLPILIIAILYPPEPGRRARVRELICSAPDGLSNVVVEIRCQS